jgi:hypothetical protein
MPSLTEMLDYIEARMQAGTQGRVEVRSAASCIQGVHTISEWFVALERDQDGDDVSIAADIIDPRTCKPSEANARNIAALLNAAPRIVAAARALLREANELNESDHQPDYRLGSGLLTGMGALLTPLYEELKRQEEKCDLGFL